MPNPINTSGAYQVKLEVFQGPLDLLLFLIKKKKIDIHDIPISTITKEYLKYLEQKEQINLEREAEFLLIAALLIHIKSQMLLPREVSLEETSDPRQILVDQLLDFQKIKAASSILRKKEKDQIKKWQRSFLPPLELSDEPEFIEVSLFDLAEIFFTLMKKKERENMVTIKGKNYSFTEKMQEIISVLKKHSFLDFVDFFNRQDSIEEALLSFFCLLELVKSKVIIVVQDTLFSSIKVWLRQEKKA
jgi:segregation and condensation protein A